MVMCVWCSGFCLMIEAAFVFKTCIISLVVVNLARALKIDAAAKRKAKHRSNGAPFLS